jgi:hypothetical protein
MITPDEAKKIVFAVPSLENEREMVSASLLSRDLLSGDGQLSLRVSSPERAELFAKELNDSGWKARAHSCYIEVGRYLVY